MIPKVSYFLLIVDVSISTRITTYEAHDLPNQISSTNRSQKAQARASNAHKNASGHARAGTGWECNAATFRSFPVRWCSFLHKTLHPYRMSGKRNHEKLFVRVFGLCSHFRLRLTENTLKTYQIESGALFRLRKLQ